METSYLKTVIAETAILETVILGAAILGTHYLVTAIAARNRHGVQKMFP